MKIIIDENNVLVDMSEEINPLENHIEVVVGVGGDKTYYKNDGVLQVVEDVAIMEGIIPQKFLYVEGEFVENPNYTAPV